MMNSVWNILKGISVECIKRLNKDVKKKKDRSCTSQVGIIKVLPVSNCLIISTESYGLSADLIESN